ncbi:MAG: hypothetical protein LBJ47_08565 [Tannerella sp.]|jgi:hypothetical protein|nr:hypothetical protein [Tannerella sp.]
MRSPEKDKERMFKVKLKEKTEEQDAAFAVMLKKAGKVRKIIKLDMPQSSWCEFGIDDEQQDIPERSKKNSYFCFNRNNCFNFAPDFK